MYMSVYIPVCTCVRMQVCIYMHACVRACILVLRFVHSSNVCTGPCELYPCCNNNAYLWGAQIDSCTTTYSTMLLFVQSTGQSADLESLVHSASTPVVGLMYILYSTYTSAVRTLVQYVRTYVCTYVHKLITKAQ